MIASLVAWLTISYTTKQAAEWTPDPVRVEVPPEVVPQVVAPAPTASDQPDDQSSKQSDEPSAAPVAIAASDIVHVDIAAIGVDIDASGPTEPRKTENCRQSSLCIDPPVGNQAAWYGVTPSVPSSDSVRVFAHNTPRGWPAAQSFNNLPAIVKGDVIVVTTKTGVFTYRAEKPQLIPYAEIPQSWLVWGDEPNRLVLVTCNNRESSGTVVEAWLESATPLK